MSYNFNSITTEDEKTVVDKFCKYGLGIAMGKWSHDVSPGSTARWEDLVRSTNGTFQYSVNDIRQKAKELAVRINNVCNDSFWGDPLVMFTSLTERDGEVSVSLVEAYTFLRAAARDRIATDEYIANKARALELEELIEKNKSKSQILKEAKAEYKKLKAVL